MRDAIAPAEQGERDPFAVFDKSAGADLVRDPYPTFASLRARSPLYEGRLERRSACRRCRRS